MSLGRRLALLDWAREAGAWILEDDYDSEYRFSGRPLEALQGLDRAGRVLYIGTFSKVLFPALRLGYLVAPTELIESLLAMRRFINEGHFARHLRHMLQHYSQRCDLLHRELRAHLGGLLEVHAPEAGMNLVGWLPPDKDDQRAVRLATQMGIEVIAISKYSLEPLPRGGTALWLCWNRRAGYSPRGENIGSCAGTALTTNLLSSPPSRCLVPTR